MLQRFGFALVLLLAGCKLGANNPIAPGFDDAPLRDGGAHEGDHSSDDGNQPDDSDDGPSDPEGPDGPGDGDDTPRHDGGLVASDAGSGSDPKADAGPARPSCGSAEFPCVAPEGCTASEHSGHTYFFCTTQVTWDEARRNCQQAGTDLLIIDDQSENDFAKANVGGDSWIGINDHGTEGTWQWIVPGSDAVSGAPLGYASWAFAQPDDCTIFGEQNCTILQTDGNWNDVSCTDGCIGGPRRYVCETY